jgi:hypothetical protein
MQNQTPPTSQRRVFLLGSLLIVLNAWFGTYAYVVVQALIWTQTSLLRGPVVVLFLLVLVNIPLIQFAKRYAFRQDELLLLYGMLCLGTCAGGYGFVQILINQMAAPFYYATPGNGWESKLWPHITSWLAPRSTAVLVPFFKGNSSFYTFTALHGWLVPVLAWSSFIFAIFWTLLCALTLFRRQWIEEERLTFPLVPLPLEMTAMGGATPFWKNRWMWGGFIAAGLAESVNYLNFLFPSFPYLPIKPIGFNRLDSLMVGHFPWNQAGMVAIAFYPFVIGIAYLLSLDISFSCWSLYLGVKVLMVLTAMLGYSEGGGGGAANRAPYFREQGMGAFIGIAMMSLWLARSAIRRALREALRPTGADRNELMSYRLAILGGGAGSVFLVVFLTSAGLALHVSLAFVGVYLCCAVTLARIVSEAGAGWAWAPQWTPAAFVTDAVGANGLNSQSITVLHGYGSWMLDMRDNPMPQQAQALKAGQSAGISARRYLAPLVWASALGVLCAFWAHLHIYYIFGASSAKVRPALVSGSTGAARQAAALISSPTRQDVAGLIAAAVGALTVVMFWYLRQRFVWWPFHPLGYAVAANSSMDYMWFPFFIAWLTKTLILRYGGITAYRRFLPFFLGLILGDYVVPSAWGVYGMLTGTQQYMVFPH